MKYIACVVWGAFLGWMLSFAVTLYFDGRPVLSLPYVIDLTKIECRDKTALERIYDESWTNVYPELHPIKKVILTEAKKKGFISAQACRNWRKSITYVQSPSENTSPYEKDKASWQKKGK